MWELGKTTRLTVDHFTDNGAYLRHGDDLSEKPETVLLPNRYIPEGTKTGSELEVFLYRDFSSILNSFSLIISDFIFLLPSRCCWVVA